MRLIITFILASLSSPAWSACIHDWSAAAQIARERKLLSVEKLRRAPAIGGEVLTTTLCEDAGRYSYKFVVRAPDGRLRTVTVNAMPPAAASIMGR